MSLRKSSSSRNGSKSFVLPKPKARRRWTPAPSSVGLALISRATGRRDMGTSSLETIATTRKRIASKLPTLIHQRGCIPQFLLGCNGGFGKLKLIGRQLDYGRRLGIWIRTEFNAVKMAPTHTDWSSV